MTYDQTPNWDWWGNARHRMRKHALDWYLREQNGRRKQSERTLAKAIGWRDESLAVERELLAQFPPVYCCYCRSQKTGFPVHYNHPAVSHGICMPCKEKQLAGIHRAALNLQPQPSTAFATC